MRQVLLLTALFALFCEPLAAHTAALLPTKQLAPLNPVRSIREMERKLQKQQTNNTAKDE